MESRHNNSGVSGNSSDEDNIRNMSQQWRWLWGFVGDGDGFSDNYMGQGNKASGIFVFFHDFLFFVFCWKKKMDGMFEGASFSEVQKIRIHELRDGLGIRLLLEGRGMGLGDKGGVFDILTFHACLWDLNLKGLWLGTWEPKLQKPNN